MKHINKLQKHKKHFLSKKMLFVLLPILTGSFFTSSCYSQNLNQTTNVQQIHQNKLFSFSKFNNDNKNVDWKLADQLMDIALNNPTQVLQTNNNNKQSDLLNVVNKLANNKLDAKRKAIFNKYAKHYYEQIKLGKFTFTSLIKLAAQNGCNLKQYEDQINSFINNNNDNSTLVNKLSSNSRNNFSSSQLYYDSQQSTTVENVVNKMHNVGVVSLALAATATALAAGYWVASAFDFGATAPSAIAATATAAVLYAQGGIIISDYNNITSMSNYNTFKNAVIQKKGYDQPWIFNNNIGQPEDMCAYISSVSRVFEIILDVFSVIHLILIAVAATVWAVPDAIILGAIDIFATYNTVQLINTC